MADTFSTIPRFADDSDRGADLRVAPGSFDVSTLDSRYFKINENLSEGNAGTIRGNIGAQKQDDQLDTLSGLSSGQATGLLGASGSVTFNAVTVSTGVTIHDTNGFLSSQTFAGGFAGSGMDISKDSAGDWVATFDKVTVRKSLASYESEIRKLFVRGGSDVWSDGHKVVEVEKILDGEVTWNDDTVTWNSADHGWSNVYRCYIPKDVAMSFQVDDLIQAKESDGRNAFTVEGKVIAVETGDPDPSVNTTRRYFDLQLDPSSDNPAADMDFARRDNASDASRRGTIYATASDDGNPFIRISVGTGTLSEFGTLPTIKGQIGRLDNITDPDFQGLPEGITDLDGTQTNLFGEYLVNIYARGSIIADHIIVHEGQSPDYIAGSSGWKIDSDGSVEFNDGTFRGEITASSGSITGTLTMGGSGKITNTAEDFTIDNEGYSVKTQATFTSPKSYKIVDDEGNVTGAIWGTDSRVFLDGRGNSAELISPSGKVLMATSNRFIEIVNGQDITIGRSTGNIILNPNLPTSDPAESGALFTQTMSQLSGGTIANFTDVVCVSDG